MNNKKKILTMWGICKEFSGVRVLDDVKFDLYSGEVHVLAGENGAGKSTLIKILAGVHTDYEGKIQLEEQIVKFKSPNDAAKNGVSVIHQEMSLIPGMSVEDNIFLGREMMRGFGWLDKNSQKNKSKTLLEQLGIDLDVSHPIEEFPISIQQMIEIAKALSYESRIIIMDEPTSALTDPEVERLFSIIKNLKSRGCGIVYISHRMEEIYKIADRITVLRDGKYIGTAPVNDLPQKELIRWMVGREISDYFPRHSLNLGDERFKVEQFSLPDPSDTKRIFIRDVSFKVHSGEILGLAGLQGSGKSELLNGIFGACGKMAKGKVWIDGEPFEILSPLHSINNGLAFLTNDRKAYGVIPGMCITHNITLSSLDEFSPYGWLNPGREKETAKNYLKSLSIKTTSIEREVSTLSGGNQQKVVLAKWLAAKPKVLLLDEPTRGIDVGAKQDIYEMMNQWTKAGLAIVLITSEMPELLAMADRIIVLHRGRITAEFKREEASQEKILQAAMGAEDYLISQN